MTMFRNICADSLHGSRLPLTPKSGSLSSIELSSDNSSSNPIIAKMEENDLKRNLNQKPSLKLYLAATSALLGAIGMGLILGWTAPAFESMSKEGSVPRLVDTPADKNAKTWIGSSMTLGALLGAIISGPTAQYFGRKKSLVMYGLPFTIGWVMITLSKSVNLLIVGRVICGLSAGLLSGTAPSYVIEISIIRIRGLLGTCFQVCVTIGILLVYLFGAFLNWRLLAGISMVPTLFMAILMIFMPESPSWLLSKGKNSEAREALKALRAEDNDNEQELSMIQDQANEAQSGHGMKLSSFKQRANYCPLLLALGLMVFQQFSGINAVMFYATSIFIESGSSITPSIATIIIGVSQVIATIIASLVVDKLGRKLLLNVSAFLSVISTTSLGFYYYYTDNQAHNSFGWVPVASLVVFIIGFSIGYGPIPWLMVAEIPPLASRSITSAMATACNWTCAFLITKNFELLKDALTKHGTFLLFSVFSMTSILFVLFFLPETKGKSADEIQQYFTKDSSTRPRDGMLKNGSNKSSTEAEKVELEKLNL